MSENKRLAIVAIFFLIGTVVLFAVGIHIILSQMSKDEVDAGVIVSIVYALLLTFPMIYLAMHAAFLAIDGIGCLLSSRKTNRKAAARR